MKYRLDLTESQTRVVATALEFYSRFLAGQWEIPNEMQCKEYVIQGKPEDFWQVRNSSEKLLEDARKMFLRYNDGFYAIGSDKLHDSAKIAYDIYRPILEQFEKETAGKSDGHSVYSYEGLSYSKEGRIKIERIK